MAASLLTPERMFEPEFYTDLARTAETAAFDAVFLADIPKSTTTSSSTQRVGSIRS